MVSCNGHSQCLSHKQFEYYPLLRIMEMAALEFTLFP